MLSTKQVHKQTILRFAYKTHIFLISNHFFISIYRPMDVSKMESKIYESSHAKSKPMIIMLSRSHDLAFIGF